MEVSKKRYEKTEEKTEKSRVCTRWRGREVWKKKGLKEYDKRCEKNMRDEMREEKETTE